MTIAVTLLLSLGLHCTLDGRRRRRELADDNGGLAFGRDDSMAPDRGGGAADGKVKGFGFGAKYAGGVADVDTDADAARQLGVHAAGAGAGAPREPV
jgi:hypothetical protein